MRYILTEFTHETGFRVFAFDGLDADRVRTPYTVRADLALTRRYGIPVQDLPLLCRGILERRNEAEQERCFTYTEADMSFRADERALRDEAVQHKKSRRAPANEKVGAAWRGTQAVRDPNTVIPE